MFRYFNLDPLSSFMNSLLNGESIIYLAYNFIAGEAGTWHRIS
jgi:hypothetical protein